MRGLRLVLVRLRGFFRRDGVAAEIREEMQFHLRMRAEDLERRGVAPDRAAREAARQFGNLALLEDRGYDVRGGGMLETITQDLRYSVRLLARQRGFSLVAIATLAVGIAAATTLFSVIHAAVLRPLPYPDPDRLVDITVGVKVRDGRVANMAPSLQDVRDWRAHAGVFTELAVDRGDREVIVELDGPERVSVQQISEGYLELFGISPRIGRAFTVEDTRPEAPLVALLGHAYWQTRFGGAADVIGRTLRIGGTAATVVGVLPRGFNREVAIFQPYRPGELERMRGTGAPVTARLRPGMTIEQAERDGGAQLTAAAAARGSLEAAGIRVRSLYDDTVRGTGPTITTLVAAAAAILLIACVNVAGLLLARGAMRLPELAIRRSIGAGRGRLVRQLLTESLVLGLCGATAGLALAWISLDGIVAIVPLSLPANAPATLNPTVLALAIALAVLVSLAAGLLPAIRLSGASAGAALASSGRRHGPALSRRGGQALIAIETALALVLLVGATLMLRSFTRLASVDLGFDPEAVVVMEVEPVDPSPAVAAAYYPALVESLRQRPGIAVVGAANFSPIGGRTRVGFAKAGEDSVRIAMRTVLPGYFEAMGLAARSGRLLTDDDRRGGPPRVILNETAARQIYGDVNPIGQLLPIEEAPEIVGLVPDVWQDGARREPPAQVYFVGQKLEASRPAPMAIYVRAPLTTALADDLRAAAHALGTPVVIDRIVTAEHFLDDWNRGPRHRTWLLTLLGSIGLVLALVGVFTVTAYAVARRTQEIGVRMAFGARPGDVVRIMLRDAVTPVAAGLALGLAASFYASRVVASFLFETTPHDPVALTLAALTLALTAALAAYLPSRRAAQVDPVRALRAE